LECRVEGRLPPADAIVSTAAVDTISFLVETVFWKGKTAGAERSF